MVIIPDCRSGNRGSIPRTPAKIRGELAELVRHPAVTRQYAMAFGVRIPGSPYKRHSSSMEELLPCKQRVVGSNPTGGSIGEIAQSVERRFEAPGIAWVQLLLSPYNLGVPGTGFRPALEAGRCGFESHRPDQNYKRGHSVHG